MKKYDYHKDKYIMMKEILEKYKQGDYIDYDHKEDYQNGWYEYTKTTKKDPTIWDLINMLKEMIKNDTNVDIVIKKILNEIPEEEIQKYLRAKKIAKIKKK
jgi:hypothetical protein